MGILKASLGSGLNSTHESLLQNLNLSLKPLLEVFRGGIESVHDLQYFTNKYRKIVMTRNTGRYRDVSMTSWNGQRLKNGNVILRYWQTVRHFLSHKSSLRELTVGERQAGGERTDQ